MDIKVSIITVAYNSAATIRDTIDSVLHQTYENIEYIIIDGSSTDDTVKLARSYEEAFVHSGREFRIVSEPDQGIYDAMNKGIHLATGQLVGIINSDDWYEPVAVERVVKTFLETSFDMFYADLRIITENKTMIKHSKLRKIVVSRDWNHPTTFITREVYEDHLYKLESVHDDWDLVLRLRRENKKIVVLNEVLANFRAGGVSNKKSLAAALKRGRARYKIYRNNGYSRWYLIECFVIEAAKMMLL